LLKLWKIKRKRLLHFSPPLFLIRPAGHFLAGPLALFPSPASFLGQPSSDGNRRRSLGPAPHDNCRHTLPSPQPLSARAHSLALSPTSPHVPRPHPVKAKPSPLHFVSSWESPPVPWPLQKGAEPFAVLPLLLPAPFSHSPSTTEAATATSKSAEVRRPPLRVAAVPEPPPSSFSLR